MGLLRGWIPAAGARAGAELRRIRGRIAAAAARTWTAAATTGESIPRLLWSILGGSLYALLGALVALLLTDAFYWAARIYFGDPSVFWAVAVQALPVALVILVWLALGPALAAGRPRHYAALVAAPAWFILVATAMAGDFFAEEARRPSATRLDDQLAAYSEVLPVFFLVFAIHWFRSGPRAGAVTSLSRTFVGIWSALVIGLAELTTLTALGQDHPHSDWAVFAAVSLVIGIVGAILLPALDLFERRVDDRLVLAARRSDP